MDRINRRIAQVYGYAVCFFGSLLLIAVSAVLFAIHWHWLKQRDPFPAAP